MIRKIFGTAGTRLLAALASFAILSINARHLGPEGLGHISLLIVALAILGNVSSLIGGSALVYLVPRHNVFQLVTLSSGWAFITSLGGGLVLMALKLVPKGYIIDVMLLSFLLALININMMVLLGKERVKAFNIITLLQNLLTVGCLFIWFEALDRATVLTFIFVLYLAYATTLLMSFIPIIPMLKSRHTEGMRLLIPRFLKFGGSIQIAGLFQTLNYRFSYFLLNKFFGGAMLGRFDAGVKLSEGLWMIGKSMALVQYARISNESEEEASRTITIAFFKISLAITLLAIGCLLMIPSDFFTFFLGKGFEEIKFTIACLAPGILAIASGMIFSHFFSGIGKPHFNTIGSAIGLTMIVAMGYVLIPHYGLAGAGIATSISYMFSLVYQIITFCALTKTPLSAFAINYNDLHAAKQLFVRKA
jgi:O-antigen/teichoic acid export membrane protein